MLKKIVLIFAAWRLLLWLPLMLAPLLLPLRKGYEYTLLPYFTKSFNPINHQLLFPWGNFDGVYYLLIALKGYTVNGGFFPLFPLVIRLSTLPFGILLPFDPLEYGLALLLVTAFTLISLWFLCYLVKLDYSENVATLTVICLLAFPAAFFLATIYSEGLFLMLAVLAFYFARKRQWLAASLCVALASATRLIGIALVPALLWEFWLLEKPKIKNLAEVFRRGWPLILSPAGLLVYAWYNLVRWGDALYFIAAQGNFRNNRSVDSLVFFPQTLFRYAKILFGLPLNQYEWWVALFELSAFFLTVILLYLAWKNKIRTSYLIFSLVAFLVPVSTGTFTGLPRYILVLFPIFMALALLKNKLVRLVYLVVGVALELLFLALFSRGFYLA